MNLIERLEKTHANAKKGPNTFIKREHYVDPSFDEDVMGRIIAALKAAEDLYCLDCRNSPCGTLCPAIKFEAAMEGVNGQPD